MKKITALLIVILMFATMLFSCNSDSTTSSTSSESKQNSTSSKSDDSSSDVSNSTNNDPKLNLPDKKWDVTLKMMVQCGDKNREQEYRYFEFWSDEATEDIVNVEVTSRSEWLKEKYGIALKLSYTAESNGAVKSAEAALSGGEQYDLIASAALDIGAVASNGYFADFNKLNKQYNDGKGWMNFDAPWWDQGVVKGLTVDNKLFFAVGDICITDDEATWAMFFNKDMITEYGLENPYKLVNEGKWTLDKMYEMAKKVTLAAGEKLEIDSNSNNKWGLLVQGYDGLMFMQGCQQKMVEKDSNDIPFLRVNEQHNIDVFQKLAEILIDEKIVGFADFYGSWDSGIYGEALKTFTNGKALFTPQAIAKVSSPEFRQSEIKYGLLPMPKYDETQTEYSSSATIYSMTVVGIPIGNANPEATCVALEALSWYGREHVTPAFYEKVLKAQRFADTESEEMLDLIFRNRTYDIAIAYNWSNMIQFYTFCLGSKQPNLVSYYDSQESVYKSAMDEAIAAFKVMNA